MGSFQEEKALKVYMVSYVFSSKVSSGHGRIFHWRYQNEGEPSVENIESMEAKIRESSDLQSVTIIGLVRLADRDEPPCQ